MEEEGGKLSGAEASFATNVVIVYSATAASTRRRRRATGRGGGGLRGRAVRRL
jgi:hypothetical protein